MVTLLYIWVLRRLVELIYRNKLIILDQLLECLSQLLKRLN